MASENIKSLVDYLSSKGKMRFLSSVSNEKLNQFEKENNVKLPNCYKEWLQFSDGGDLFLPAGVQLYGIEHKPTIDINDNSRPNDNYIVIGCLSSGDPILFKKDSESIAIYNQNAGKIEDDEIYADFNLFLRELPKIFGMEC